MGILKCEQYAAVLCMSGTSFNPDKFPNFRRLVGNRPVDPDIMPMISLESIYGGLKKFKGGPNDMWQAARLNIEQGKKLPKFFFTVGDQDFAREHVEDAFQYLTSLGYDTFFELVSGYGHEWDFWDLTLKKALESWLPIRHEVIYPE
jgi:S-formylglutathione hydrolase FrmB